MKVRLCKVCGGPLVQHSSIGLRRCEMELDQRTTFQDRLDGVERRRLESKLELHQR